jgi:chromosome segregation ATPase
MISADRNHNVPSSVRPSEQDGAANALDLVYQAAEVFRNMEVHAREVEARAESMCKSAAEKLQQAEGRIEAAERSRQEIATEAASQLQLASGAIKRVQASLEDAQGQLTAMEFRAQRAEAEAREAKQALALVEEAIRKHLLCAHPKTESGIKTSGPGEAA